MPNFGCRYVVIHSISTSNHNDIIYETTFTYVVIHSISTSNHNYFCSQLFERGL